MRAIILAAGQGLRLKQTDDAHVPKVLLTFDGKTLLERHLILLKEHGVDEVILVLGFRHELIEQELDRIDWQPRPRIIINDRYTLGSMLSADAASEMMTRGGDVLLMDGDVLYDRRITQALVQDSEVGNRVLIDREFEAGEEPVKVCVRAGVPVEFRKRLPAALEYDLIGESVGFFRFDEQGAARLTQIIRRYADDGQGNLPHEEAVRDFLLEGSQQIEICDVTGSPWIEIDFPDDVDRAASEILPSLVPV